MLEALRSFLDDLTAGTRAEAAAPAFKASGAKIACLCASDALYAEQDESVARALVGAGATRIYLAGRPGAEEQRWRAAGVDAFLFAGCDALALLEDLRGHLTSQPGKS